MTEFAGGEGITKLNPDGGGGKSERKRRGSHITGLTKLGGKVK